MLKITSPREQIKSIQGNKFYSTVYVKQVQKAPRERNECTNAPPKIMPGSFELNSRALDLHIIVNEQCPICTMYLTLSTVQIIDSSHTSFRNKLYQVILCPFFVSLYQVYLCEISSPALNNWRVSLVSDKNLFDSLTYNINFKI